MTGERYIEEFKVGYKYPVVFTSGMFERESSAFLNLFKEEKAQTPKALFVIDQGVFNAHPQLADKITEYSGRQKRYTLAAKPEVVPGGEMVKNSRIWVDRILELVNKHDICRHSYLVVIGGGAVIDMAGFAAAIAHRGIRLIRVPTTVLAQNDSGIGVKCGINAFGKKNFLGCFYPPYAVINDFQFIKTLEERDVRSGIAEAVKVAVIKDKDFFCWHEKSAALLTKGDEECMKEMIQRCAILHLQHIAGAGDPFESGTSRPLDFGHWAAHKLEELTNFDLRHGEAVAIGIALDSCYSFLKGISSQSDFMRIVKVLRKLGFNLYVPELENPALLAGLEAFRVHLGGTLTITLPDVIGSGVEVHDVDHALMTEAVRILKEYSSVKQKNEY